MTNLAQAEFDALGRVGATDEKLQGRRYEYWLGFPNNVTDANVSDESGSVILDLDDAGGYVRIASPTGVTCTVPPSSSANYNIGARITIVQGGVGSVTLVAGSGVTLNTPSTLALTVQYSDLTITKVGTDTWDVNGMAPGRYG